MIAAPNMRRKNHYVPQFLLQNFATLIDETKVLEYRLLVDHNNIPDWEPRPIKSTARHIDLYTIAHDADESDALEIWLEETFESPGALAVKKAIQNKALDAQDVRLLARLFLAQLVRTPSWYIRHKNRLVKQTESMARGILERIERERPQLNVRPNSPLNIDADEGFPLRMRVELVDDKYRMNLMTAAGRKMWMWSIATFSEKMVRSPGCKLSNGRFCRLHPALIGHSQTIPPSQRPHCKMACGTIPLRWTHPALI